MHGDTVRETVAEATQDWEALRIVPNGIERMLQGQDLAAYIALRQAEKRASWLYQRRLTEDDVYGRHANPRPIEPGDTLGRLVIQPKGMIETRLCYDYDQVLRIDHHRDPEYVGEHRRPRRPSTYADGMTYLCGRSLFRVDGDYPDELIAWVDDHDEADVYGGYVNQ